MTISLLADHVEFVPTLADWFVREWEPYYGAEGPGDAFADLKSRCNRDAIPIALVACQDRALQGVVSIDVDAATNLAPSIVGLLVASEYRRQGIAAALLESATGLARRLGYRRVYLSTSVLGDHLRRSGWELYGEARFLNDERGSIYVIDLQDQQWQ